MRVQTGIAHPGPYVGQPIEREERDRCGAMLGRRVALLDGAADARLEEVARRAHGTTAHRFATLRRQQRRVGAQLAVRRAANGAQDRRGQHRGERVVDHRLPRPRERLGGEHGVERGPHHHRLESSHTRQQAQVLARGDADGDTDARRTGRGGHAADAAHRGLQRHRGACRRELMTLAGEHHHQPVPGEFHHVTVLAEHGVDARLEDGVDGALHHLGACALHPRDALGQAGEARQVGEHHRRLAPTPRVVGVRIPAECQVGHVRREPIHGRAV